MKPGKQLGTMATPVAWAHGSEISISETILPRVISVPDHYPADCTHNHMNIETKNPVLEFAGGGEKLRGALSAAVLLGNDLWVASDELTSVERLTLHAGKSFRAHRSFELQGLINLPAHGQKKANGKDVD